ncbi:MAG: murein biosynthesis integral membrane protein MurJ [Anaerolineae bacterium]|nr:murein biosynthesis integral membrane protein MurJ [Anaerolineales bacterium]MCQ3975376.1 murein biosynthesis integral membrane protein MurJ [Anaerolineae bacterium]
MNQLETTRTAATTHRLARAASLVMVLFLASRALGLLREVVIARQFGTSAEMDAYLAAFRLPDFLFYVVAGGALGSAFIPIFTGYLAREDLPGAWRLASAVINWVALFLTGLGGLAALFAPWIVQRFFADFSPAQQTLTVELMRWMLISTVIFGVSGVVMGILNAHQHFFLPALAPVIYNLAIILSAWLLGPLWGVRGLAAGVVAGAASHLLVQLPGLLSGERLRYQPVLAWRDPSLREVARLMGPRVLGLAAVQLNFVVNAVLAAGLTAGSLTALNYGWIIMLLPQGIIAQAVATALFPTLAALAATEQWAELRRIFAVTLRSLLFLTLPAAAGLLVLSEPLVRLLLERGKFDPAATTATAWALSFFALGLTGHAVVEIATRAFYALKNTKTPVAVGVAAMAVNIGLSWLLLRLFAGWGWPPHGGLALANSIAVTLEMIALLALLRPQMGGLAEGGLVGAVAKMGLATAGMALALALLLPFLPPAPGWLGGVIGVGVGSLVYLGLVYVLRIDELKTISRNLLRRN